MTTEITAQELLTMNKRVKTEDDYFAISNKIKALLQTGLSNLKNSGFDNSNQETDDEELDRYLNELSKQAEGIGDKFVTGLGQMYKGVIIKEELSVRENGGVYPYRCQWRMDAEQIAKLLLQHREEVMSNMGEEKGSKVFTIIDKLFANGRSILQIDTSMASGTLPIKPFNIFDFETKGYSDEFLHKGEIMRICQLTYNRGKICFENEDGSSISNTIIHKICLSKHQDVIKQIRDNIVAQLQSKKTELTQVEALITDLMGKYLIVAELNNGKESIGL